MTEPRRFVEEAAVVARERPVSPVVPITSTPATAAEVAAFGQVSLYLDRAASEVGTLLLGREGRDGDAALLASLRESLVNSAGLCADLLDLAAQQAGSRR